MDIDQIATLLPHRYPFLMIDRVEEVEPGGARGREVCDGE